MRMLWWQASAMLGWTSLALALVFGLVFVATGVEQAAGGWSAAMGGALSVAPDLAVRLAPLCCGLGAAMTLARRMGAGEDVGLGACGVRPWVSGRGVVLVGLGVGLLSSVASDRVLPSVQQDRPTAEWIWLDAGPVRAADGQQVLISDGRIQGVQTGVSVSTERVELASWSRFPGSAPDAALRQSTSPPARAEYWARKTRVVLCGLLAWLGWVPVGRRGVTQVAWALGVGTTAMGIDALLRQLAGQGQTPVGVAALGTLVLLSLVALRLRERS